MILLQSLQSVRSLDELILWGGYALLFAIIFAETGLLAGFFLPGDSLLITAGLIAASGQLDITTLLITLISGAVLGDATGYLIGRQLEKSIFRRRNTPFFHREHLEKTQAFYERHGSKTVFLARFVPIVRSFAATMAGVAGMPFATFFLYSLSGATIWVLLFTWSGYAIATLFPEVVNYLHTIILVGIVLIIASAIKNLRTGKKEG